MKLDNMGLANFHRDAQLSRRTFLKRTATGVGGVALTSMLSGSAGAGGKLVIPPKCKRVIHLCMAGGPSHLETLDYKPKLTHLMVCVLHIVSCIYIIEY